MNLASLAEQNLVEFGEYERIIFEGKSFTNRELADRASRFATALASLGLGPGDKVVMMMPNGPEVLIAYEGIWRAGMTVIPVLFLLEAHELRYILDDSEAKAVVTSPDVYEKVAEATKDIGRSVRVIVTGERETLPAGCLSFDELLAKHPPLKEIVPREGNDIATILYTSGTTGQPKGVMQTHRNLHANVMNAWNTATTRELGQMSLLVLPLAHTFGLSVLVGGYLFGSRGVLMRWFNPETALELIERHKVKLMSGVPTMFVYMLMHPNADKYDTSSVTRWLVGAAPMPMEQLRSFEKKFGGTMYVGYGLTESCPTLAVEREGMPRKAGSTGVPVEHHRHEEQRQERRRRQPADDGERERLVRLRALLEPERGRDEADDVARLVIMMGTKRDRAASTMASTFSFPSRRAAVRVVDEEDAVRHGDADDHQDAHERRDREALPGRHEREDDPHERHGDGEEHDERQPQRLELRRHDHEDDHHREPEREAEPRERRPHQLDLADEVVLDVARRGVFASASSRSFAALPRSRPSVCMRTCAARSRWFRSTAIGPTSDDVAVAPRRTGRPSGSTRTGSSAELLGVGDAARRRRRDDVVRLAVVGVDPHARRVDVAERRVERRLRGVASRRRRRSPPSRGRCRRGSPGSRAAATCGRRGRRGSCARRRRSRSPARRSCGEVVAADLDDERRRVAVGEDARDEAAGVLSTSTPGNSRVRISRAFAASSSCESLRFSGSENCSAGSRCSGATFGLTSALRAFCGVPRFSMTISTAPRGAPRERLAHRADLRDASSTTCPARSARRSVHRLVDLGEERARQPRRRPAAPDDEHDGDAPMMVQRYGSTCESAASSARPSRR
jgi:acyl-CoA synthetase (AMP-forming)/AMP-acid ligase II